MDKATDKAKPDENAPKAPEPIKPEELEGFQLSPELQGTLDDLKAEVETLDTRKNAYVDQANRQIAAFDGAIEQAKLTASKIQGKAEHAYVMARRAAAACEKAESPSTTEPAGNTEPSAAEPAVGATQDV